VLRAPVFERQRLELNRHSPRSRRPELAFARTEVTFDRRYVGFARTATTFVRSRAALPRYDDGEPRSQYRFERNRE